MARNDALLRLHKSLMGRRDELRKRLGGELKDVRVSQKRARVSAPAPEQSQQAGNPPRRRRRRQTPVEDALVDI